MKTVCIDGQHGGTGFIHIFGMEHAVQSQAQLFNFADETKLLTGTTAFARLQ